MPNKDNELVPGFDVKIFPVGSNGAAEGNAPVHMPTQNGNGYLVTSGTNTPIILVPPAPQPQAPAQPSLVVITLAPKKDEKEKEKKSSSVFQRL